MHSCWCGNADLLPFSPDYGRCNACETLVYLKDMPPEQLLVRDDETDFYGKKYWLEHQQDAFGYADIHTRARNDLTERNLHWLDTLLKYRLPPAKVLELGCSHGSFVALLRQAGYDATGVEMSPWVVEFGRQTFGVPISVGPVEDLDIEPGSLDLIVLMDVLEHLPDPVATMAHCLNLLKPDSLLLIQTPQFREEMDYSALVESKARFLEMLIPDEHIYLFSEHSVTRLFQQLGAEHIQFEPAIFGHYDMFFVVSRVPLAAQDYSIIQETLLATPHGRSVLALLDLRQRETKLIDRLGDSEADRVLRGEQIEKLTGMLKECEADRVSRGEQIEKMSGHGRSVLALLGLGQRETELINRLGDSEADRVLRGEQIEKLTGMLKECEADRVSRGEQIEKLTGMLKECEANSVSRGEQIENQHALLRQAEPVQLKTIAVDLTPILPGGANGGAKIFVLELLHRLAAMQPKTQFILLTQAVSHDELASMDSANMSRRMVVGPVVAKTLRPRLQGLARRLLPHLPIRLQGLAMGLGYRINAVLKRRGSSTLLSDLGADLLFCPFTAPTYSEPGIPTVCTIYDLQYKTYPDFFAPEDVAHRDWTFIEACRQAAALTAISDYSRETAIRHGDIDPDRIRTIHLRMAHRIAAQPDENLEVLKRLGLVADRYLIYPANFWKHKNHEMLLTAFGMACQAGLAADIKLVCTGTPGERQGYLAQAATALGLGERIVFPGYLPSEDLAALLADARGVVFPSLYEGFGLPVVEAMAAGIPVACSNVTSLPEVAADAAILFDPRVPTQIADAIATLAEGEATRNRLISAGRQRAAEFADSNRMAREYWNLFLSAANTEPQDNLLTGLHADGWCGPQLTLRLAKSSAKRTLEMELSSPAWLPAAKIQISATLDRKALGKVFELLRGADGTVSLPLAADAKVLVLQIAPVFVPARHAMGEDARELSLILKRCTLRADDGISQQIYPEPNVSRSFAEIGNQ